MAIGVQCTEKQNDISMVFSTPGNLIFGFCLISIFVLGSYLILRKCMKKTDIRVEMPEALSAMYFRDQLPNLQ